MISVSNREHWLIEKSINQPDKKIIITPNKNFSYQKLAIESVAAVDFLTSKGIQQNNHIGILSGHKYSFFVIVNALWFIGAVPVPLNTKLLPEELEQQIEQADIKFLLIDENLSEQFSHLYFQNKIYITYNSEKVKEIKSNKNLNSKFSLLNYALIMFTSGSTGKPKAAVHTFESLFENANAIDSFANLSSEDIWLASLPFYHIGGFMILIRALISGSSIAFPESLDHTYVAKAIKDFLPTHISIVPTTLFRLLNENVYPNANLKYVYLGGGPSDRELILNAFNKGWPIVKVYGSTETCSMVTVLNSNVVKEKPESAGKVIGMNKIKIMNKNKSYVITSTDEIGEIIVQSKSLFKEYYNNKELTSEHLQNGWFYTGDFGRIDEAGYLFIDSRREDLIITGGENVSALEVETAIKSIPAVDDVFVFALQDQNWGQIVCAAIACERVNEEEIIKFLKTKIAGYKIPKRFFLVDKIAKNEMGKITRAEVFKQLKLD